MSVLWKLKHDNRMYHLIYSVRKRTDLLSFWHLHDCIEYGAFGRPFFKVVLKIVSHKINSEKCLTYPNSFRYF